MEEFGYMIPVRVLFMIGIPTCIIGIIIYSIIQKKKGNLALGNVVYLVLFSAYILLLIGVTQFPLRHEPSIRETWRYNYIPFKTFFDLREITAKLGPKTLLLNVVGNMILLVPFAFLLKLKVQELKFKKMLLIGVIASFSIEGLQFILNNIFDPTRTLDIDDLIFNTIGVVLGYLIAKIFLKMFYVEEVKELN